MEKMGLLQENEHLRSELSKAEIAIDALNNEIKHLLMKVNQQEQHLMDKIELIKDYKDLVKSSIEAIRNLEKNAS